MKKSSRKTVGWLISAICVTVAVVTTVAVIKIKEQYEYDDEDILLP